MPAASAPISSTASRCRTVRATSSAASESAIPATTADLRERLQQRHEERIQGEEGRASGLAIAVVGDRQVPHRVPAGGGCHQPVRRAAERRRHRARIEVAPAARPTDHRQARRSRRPIPRAGSTIGPATRSRAPGAIQRHRPDRALRRGGAWLRGEGLGRCWARALHVRLRSSHSAARAGGCKCRAAKQVPLESPSPAAAHPSRSPSRIGPGMSRRQRQKRRKQRNGGFRKGFLIALSVGIVAGFLGVLGVVGYIIGVAASAPSIDSLKPIDHGQTSVVYAADGKRLGFITSDELRTPVQYSAIPTDAEAGHRGDRGPALLPAQGRRLRGHPPRRPEEPRVGLDRAGRLDDHDAARPQPVHGTTATATSSARSARPSWPRSSSASTTRPGSSPTTSTTSPTGPWAGRRRSASRPRPASSSTSRSASSTSSRRRARRPPPGAVALQPLPRPARRHQAAQQRAEQDGRAAHDHPPAGGRPPRPQPLGVRQNTYYSAKRENYFFDYVKEQLIERYGVTTVAQGRPEGLHDDRPQYAARGAQRDGGCAQRVR